MREKAHRPALRVGLGQFKPRKARVNENLARVRERIASVSGALDLVVFPEASLSGYFLEGGVTEAALESEEVAAGLGEAPDGYPDVVVGFYERWRRRLYNSVAHFTPRDGRYRPLHVHRKMFLPTYGVFDEARFVETGHSLEAYDTRFGRMGMLVCEEMWHSFPPSVLALGGAELLLVVSASPAREFQHGGSGRPGNLERWDAVASAAAVEHGVFVVVSQLVGSEGGKVFPGGSVVVGCDGRILARGPLFEECMVTARLDPASIERARYETPLLADLEQMMPHLQASLDRALEARADGAQDGRGGGALRGGAPDTVADHPRPDDGAVLALDVPLVEEVLVQFIRDEVKRRGFDAVVMGVSGGVDSAVALYLAARALGPEHVHAFRLPYRTSSQESLEHAQLLIDATGVHGETIEISDAVDAYVRTYDQEISPLRRGNLMARMRGVVLFDQSAKLGALPLGTGNKSERLLGYFTWHADDSPPINPLGDLFKTQVWLLARHVGVPDVIVEKPATADLVRGVTDEAELGISYHRADPILYWLLQGYRPPELVRLGGAEGAGGPGWGRR